MMTDCYRLFNGDGVVRVVVASAVHGKDNREHMKNELESFLGVCLRNNENENLSNGISHVVCV